MSQPVFLYWHQGWNEAPPIVKICAESWVRHHPTEQWTVHLLDKDNVHPWLESCDPEDVDGLARFLVRKEKGENVGGLALYTDLLRLALLDTYGGIWTDATTLCFEPLDSWLPAPVSMGMPRSLATERRTETWFIDNRCKDPLLTQWKNRYRDLYFSQGNKITYLDNWSTKPFQISYWMINIGMRSTGLSARVWNSKLALKGIKKRPYFATNSALEHVLRKEASRQGMTKLHHLILGINSELMLELHLSDWSQPMSAFAASRFLQSPFIKLNHKDKWASVISSTNMDSNAAWAVWLKRAEG